MDSVNSGFWISILVGGSVVAAMSAWQQNASKQHGESLQYRPIIRDFCIGAFLAAIVYMFLPDSIQSGIETVKKQVVGSMSFLQKGGASLPSLPSLSSFSSVLAPAAAGAAAEVPKVLSTDLEIQTGPARF